MLDVADVRRNDLRSRCATSRRTAPASARRRPCRRPLPARRAARPATRAALVQRCLSARATPPHGHGRPRWRRPGAPRPHRARAPARHGACTGCHRLARPPSPARAPRTPPCRFRTSQAVYHDAPRRVSDPRPALRQADIGAPVRCAPGAKFPRQTGGARPRAGLAAATRRRRHAMIQDVQKELATALSKAHDALKSELTKLRAGRANASLPRRHQGRLLRRAHGARPR